MSYLTEEMRDELLNLLSEEDAKFFSEIGEEDIICHHHSLGQFIRNHFKLWVNYKEGDEHPDDISYYMMCELCKYLKEHFDKKEIKLMTLFTEIPKLILEEVLGISNDAPYSYSIQNDNTIISTQPCSISEGSFIDTVITIEEFLEEYYVFSIQRLQL